MANQAELETLKAILHIILTWKKDMQNISKEHGCSWDRAMKERKLSKVPSRSKNKDGWKREEKQRKCQEEEDKRIQQERRKQEANAFRKS